MKCNEMQCKPTAGLEPAVLGLEVPRLIHWATRAAAVVHGVGFEPTSANTVDLKSTPLDLSGNLAFRWCSQPGLNRRPSAHKTDALTN